MQPPDPNTAPVQTSIPASITARDVVQGRTAREEQALLDIVRRLRLRCPRCRYDLSHAVSTTCPECGVAFAAADFRVRIENLPASPRLLCTLIGLCPWVAGGGLILGITLIPGLAGLVAGGVATLLALWLLIRIARKPVTYLMQGEHIRLPVDLLLALPGLLMIALALVVPMALFLGWF